ncbi:MAG: hypothetical protein TQ35_0007715 [Candidatus Aramenus sulfurataquae]|jgi:uncharacterized protein (DUF302 family)|uniref:Uncharacterized protein n=2 Tax=Candidatus Aramenus sulfurataquae TaxID=1326980 RepID=A0A0F2LM12_9CREN|nr:hypothetical protein [Candidatus Aramenus sulfurataquae]
MKAFKPKCDFETTLKMLEGSVISNDMKIISRVNAQENLRRADFKTMENYILTYLDRAIHSSSSPGT